MPAEARALLPQVQVWLTEIRALQTTQNRTAERNAESDPIRRTRYSTVGRSAGHWLNHAAAENALPSNRDR